MNANVKKRLSDNMMWLVLIALIIVMSIGNSNFFTIANFRTLLTSESVKGVMAFGVAFCILTKGIDLSIGASAGLIACVTGALVQPLDYASKILTGVQLPAIVAILIALAMGCAIGAIQGAIIAYTKMPAFIATLGGQLICRAAAKVFTTRPVSNLSDGYRFLGNGQIGPIPVIVVVFVIVCLLAAFILGQTRFGKSLYAIGGNDQAARVAGINVERNLVLTYVWCGVLAALAGVLLAGRAGSADPATSGLNYELDAIAAATVGGTSHTGGICRISGVLCGILILGVINNGLVLLGVNDNYTNIIKGIIIVGAVALDMKKNTRKA
ncbi:MAG TPA: hypothetical protein IAB54_06075 [Candidatus Scatomonas merdigallinarum]|nr:hypothetical protein [Candidatus Scatomonas merdigallinarum]